MLRRVVGTLDLPPREAEVRGALVASQLVGLVWMAKNADEPGPDNATADGGATNEPGGPGNDGMMDRIDVIEGTMSASPGPTPRASATRTTSPTSP